MRGENIIRTEKIRFQVTAEHGMTSCHRQSLQVELGSFVRIGIEACSEEKNWLPEILVLMDKEVKRVVNGEET